MTFSYRVNVEDVFFRLADSAYAEAKSGMAEIQDFDPVKLEQVSFRGPGTDEAIGQAVIAVVGWAVGVEAVTNLSWNHRFSRTLPKKEFHRLLRTKSTMQKIDYLLTFEAEPGREKPFWFPQLAKLFELRNRFVHYKEGLAYQGFEFAPEVLKALSEATMEELRRSVGTAIEALAALDPRLHTGFLSGDYALVHEEG